MKSMTVFESDAPSEIWGLVVKRITFTAIAENPVTKVMEARSAFGRAVIVNPNEFDIQAFPFYDLINSSKGTAPTVGCCPEPNVNLGATVKDFVEGSRRESAKGGIYEKDAKRCIFAMNPLHTNFVRPNGFIICQRKVISKPERYDALGLDCDSFMPLHGPYTAFVIDGGTAKVDTLMFDRGQPPSTLPEFAISGPALIKDGGDVSDNIPFRPTPRDKEPYGVIGTPSFLRLPPGPTRGDEVNYPPPSTMTSFSAIGVRESGELIFVSMFEESRGHGNGCGHGITVYEMAELLMHRQLEAQYAIVSGGGADTQQFLRGDWPQFLTAPVRARAPHQAPRSEVEGPRGLGAILGILARQ